jgi:hypothetical protein
MRSRGGRTIKVTPVDEDTHQVQDHPDRGRIEALMDQNLFRMHIRRERSSAYWFAATLWGVSGLVLGALLGGFMMFQAYVGLTDPVRETLVQGQAIQAAQDSVNSRDPIVSRDAPGQPNQ